MLFGIILEFQQRAQPSPSLSFAKSAAENDLLVSTSHLAICIPSRAASHANTLMDLLLTKMIELLSSFLLTLQALNVPFMALLAIFCIGILWISLPWHSGKPRFHNRSISPVSVPMDASSTPSRQRQRWDAFLVLDVEGTCETGTTFSYPNEIIASGFHSCPAFFSLIHIPILESSGMARCFVAVDRQAGRWHRI